MTTITRERLLKIQQWRETYGAGSNVMLPAEEAAELARIALASLEAEPIGYMNRFTGRVFSLDEQPGADTDTDVYEPVYAAPPAPVVPDGYALVPVEPTDEMIAAAMNCEDVLFNSDESFCVQFGNIYEAMLAAAPQPQNAPQNIPAGKSTLTPDGWISCSERMPAQDDWVLIYSKHGEYLAGQVQGEYVELNDGTLSWLGSALHWMLLPEPPQQDSE
ncbi:DUF551 domain-containing protein [Salmonella enterica]|nr:DUF551 domain-containing protein [Salmonella enterica]EAY8675725.1 DUF551 domain-containing protein [Salmonella enterica]